QQLRLCGAVGSAGSRGSAAPDRLESQAWPANSKAAAEVPPGANQRVGLFHQRQASFSQPTCVQELTKKRQPTLWTRFCAGEIPVEQAAKFDLVINLTTAKVLGLTIPESK